jgi:hypothetical protein
MPDSEYRRRWNNGAPVGAGAGLGAVLLMVANHGAVRGIKDFFRLGSGGSANRSRSFSA